MVHTAKYTTQLMVCSRQITLKVPTRRWPKLQGFVVF